MTTTAESTAVPTSSATKEHIDHIVHVLSTKATSTFVHVLPAVVPMSLPLITQDVVSFTHVFEILFCLFTIFCCHFVRVAFECRLFVGFFNCSLVSTFVYTQYF